MKTQNITLLVGALIISFFAYRWFVTQNPTYEPLVTLLSSVLTSISYYFTLKQSKEANEIDSYKIYQTQKGGKGNVQIGGDVSNVTNITNPDEWKRISQNNLK